MQCNISRTGRRIRLAGGILTSLAAIVLAALMLAGTVGGAWAWPAVILLLLVGGFQIVEGTLGWCAVRAMGLRTPF